MKPRTTMEDKALYVASTLRISAALRDVSAWLFE